MPSVCIDSRYEIQSAGDGTYDLDIGGSLDLRGAALEEAIVRVKDSYRAGAMPERAIRAAFAEHAKPTNVKPATAEQLP